MKQLLLIAGLIISFYGSLQAQRLFLDIPNIYATVPDFEQVSNNLGLGIETAMNVGSHWSVARLGGGSAFTLDPQSNEVEESFTTLPYVFFEAGAGKYRSNGNQCAKTKANAYTIMAKAGLRYNIYTGDLRSAADKAGELDYGVGAEFGYFFIRDIFRNYEFFVDSRYFIKSKTVSANLGFKMFLNLRANRD